MTAADTIAWARAVLDGRKWRSDEKGLRDIVSALTDLADALAQENDKLRALVQPAKDLVECWDWWTVDEYDRDRGGVSDSIEEIRTAIAALGDTP